MRYLALEYLGPPFDQVFNLGDDIQTLAVERLLPRVDGYVSREALDQVREPAIVAMNGFFMQSDHWPPADAVVPLFFAFHVAPGKRHVMLSPPGIDYLRRHAPIGCRDEGTVALLASHGIEAFYSRCVTLTFERRERAPADGKVFLVAGTGMDFESIIPRSLRREAIHVNQAKLRLPHFSAGLRRQMAAELLAAYRDHARLVITTKIHCAMPCIAMGIPVVFLYDAAKRDDYRVRLIDELVGIHYVDDSPLKGRPLNPLRCGQIDWSPAPAEVEPLKASIRQGFAEALARAEARFVAGGGR